MTMEIPRAAGQYLQAMGKQWNGTTSGAEDSGAGKIGPKGEDIKVDSIISEEDEDAPRDPSNG